jgi:hypothetical protein
MPQGTSCSPKRQVGEAYRHKAVSLSRKPCFLGFLGIKRPEIQAEEHRQAGDFLEVPGIFLNPCRKACMKVH